MNLRDFDYICAVAEHRHFGKAAEACNVSQPTLSGQIKKLETLLGVTLFERGHKAVRVTETGGEIIAIAKEAQDAVRRIHAVSEASKDPLAGHINLGLIPTIAPYLIPLFVRHLKADIPKLTITYNEDITERLTRDLIDGRLHAAILATPPETDALMAIPLYSEPFWITYPATHLLQAQASISMKDVASEDILLLTDGHCFRDQALSICHPQPSQNGHSLRATSLETLINLVAAGQGVTLIPALVMETGLADNTQLSARPVSDKNAARTIYLTYRKRYPRVSALHALAALITQNLPPTVEKL